MVYVTIDAKDFGVVTVRKTNSSLIISSLRGHKARNPVINSSKNPAIADFKIKLSYSWVENIIKSLVEWADNKSEDLTPRTYLFPKKLGIKKPLIISRRKDVFIGWIPYKKEKKKFSVSVKFLSSFILAINGVKKDSGEEAA